MKEPVRIGAVGLGGHGRAMLKAVQASGTCKLVTGFDTDPGVSRAFETDFALPTAPSYKALLAEEAVEAVSLVVPNFLHADMAVAASEAGKACFVEKPIANTVDEAERMINACASKGVLLSVGHNFRRLGEVRKAKALLEAGTLGTVAACEGNLSRPGAAILAPDDWRRDPETCPLPPMMQLGIHLVDAYRYLFGPVARVTALTHPPTSPPETAVGSLLHFASGTVGYIGANYHSKEGWFLRILGTRANLILEPGRVVLERQDGPPTEQAFTPVDTLAEEMHEFGNAVRGHAPIEVDGTAGLEALKVVLAFLTSAREGRAQEI
ncbi:MAG: Gfo/Idh/MocA family protein [Planctomycetota bacterium]|jgi:UDP-N-acetylglucosamine 3-dehydrogenase